MEQIKQHWPKIAVGAVAIALGVYMLSRQSKEQAAVQDIKEQIKAIKPNEWPKMRRVIDYSAT